MFGTPIISDDGLPLLTNNIFQIPPPPFYLDHPRILIFRLSVGPPPLLFGTTEYFNFKKRYSMTNLGLVSFNKRFLYAAAMTPGSTHNARRLKEFNIYSNFRRRYYARQLFNLVISGRFHLLPLVTVSSLNMNGYLKRITRGYVDKEDKQIRKHRI